MARHFQRLTPDQQALVREFQPYPGVSKAATKRNVCARLGWSMSKFYAIQCELVDAGWPLKPTSETVAVKFRGRTVRRPLFRILKTVDEYNDSAQKERAYNVTRIETGQKVQRQGEKDNRTAASVFNEEQRLKTAGDVLEGKPTPVPIGHSANDPDLIEANDGGQVLTPDEVAAFVASYTKQHPRFR